jgi:hypothetical protein
VVNCDDEVETFSEGSVFAGLDFEGWRCLHFLYNDQRPHPFEAFTERDIIPCWMFGISIAPGGIEPMAPHGYRIFLMRDATLGGECPDTFAERVATRWGTRYFENHYGSTIAYADFVEALA